jgi:hypothetical protein
MQIDDDSDDGRSGADRRGPASRRLLATNAPAAAVLAALVLFPACLRADDVQAIVRQQPWSCWFGGRTVTLRYQLAGPAAAGSRASWSFAVQDQVVARRKTAVEVTPGQPGTLEIRLDLPTARAELVIPATVSVALDAGPRVEHRLWIFPEDPFVGRRALMEKMNISVFDPEGKTVRRLEEHRVPVRVVRDVGSLGRVNDGLVLIGEAVSFRQWRTLAATIIDRAATGVPVICLAPAAGELPAPGIGQSELPRPSSVFLRQSDVITALDKRLDTVWPPDGDAVASRIKLVAGRSGIEGQVGAKDGGWPWVEFVFPAPRGRLIICGLAIVAKWEAEPTPRYVLANLLEYASGLREIGLEAKTAVPALVELLDDKNREVRSAAADTRRNMCPEKRDELRAMTPVRMRPQDHRPDIEITLERPADEVVLGRPILLTAVFKSNLKRDVQIEGFHPEGGFDIGGRTICACKVTSRIVRATTEVAVERLSGTCAERDRVLQLEPGEGRSFLLKAAGSEKRSFDLMKTFHGAMAIDSAGRFRVSLVFRVQAEMSEGWSRDASEWEGEACAAPIEIAVAANAAN